MSASKTLPTGKHLSKTSLAFVFVVLFWFVLDFLVFGFVLRAWLQVCVLVFLFNSENRMVAFWDRIPG